MDRNHWIKLPKWSKTMYKRRMELLCRQKSLLDEIILEFSPPSSKIRRIHPPQQRADLSNSSVSEPRSISTLPPNDPVVGNGTTGDEIVGSQVDPPHQTQQFSYQQRAFLFGRRPMQQPDAVAMDKEEAQAAIGTHAVSVFSSQAERDALVDESEALKASRNNVRRPPVGTHVQSGFI